MTPELGQIVKVLRGKDPGEYAVVIGIVDTRFVWLADGDKRKFDQPKKKNLTHLQLQETISSEVESSIRETGRVTNGKLRHALAKFAEQTQVEAHEKGE
ncbi:KOW domain-containing RNA-binding protein [Paenibacillus aestuarii]|uniref:RNA-binding protein n=1 Tax=Paenibacillus aestuarii TaxID=516965 RepID=A0ABW0KFN6_9BACL|nr:KOW domain-containing RNA-binding protein [Paenibacillus aestuarii]